MAPKWNIAFLVEGDVDKAITETLGARVLSELVGLESTEFRVHAVRGGGKNTLRWAYSTVYYLLQNNDYHYVVVVQDADTIDVDLQQALQIRIHAMLEEQGLTTDVVDVCVPMPTIEAWLLAQYEEEPEKQRDPKKILCERLGLKRIDAAFVAKEASALDLKLARKRSASFERFVTTLMKVIGEQKAAA